MYGVFQKVHQKLQTNSPKKTTNPQKRDLEFFGFFGALSKSVGIKSVLFRTFGPVPKIDRTCWKDHYNARLGSMRSVARRRVPSEAP